MAAVLTLAGCGFSEIPVAPVNCVDCENVDGDGTGGGSGGGSGTPTPGDEIVAVISPSTAITVLPGETFTLDGSASMGSGITYQWSGAGNCPAFSDSDEVTLTVSAPLDEGACDITLEVAGEGQSSTTSVTVTVQGVGLVVSPAPPCTDDDPTVPVAGNGGPSMPWCSISSALTAAQTLSGARTILIDRAFSYTESLTFGGAIVLDGSYARAPDNTAQLRAVIQGSVKIGSGGAGLRNLVIEGSPCPSVDLCESVGASAGPIEITGSTIGCDAQLGQPFQTTMATFFAFRSTVTTGLQITDSRFCGANQSAFDSGLMLDGRSGSNNSGGTLSGVTVVVGGGSASRGLHVVNTENLTVSNLTIDTGGALAESAVGFRDGLSASNDVFPCGTGEFCDSSFGLGLDGYSIDVTAVSSAVGIELIGTIDGAFSPGASGSVVSVGANSSRGIATYAVQQVSFDQAPDQAGSATAVLEIAATGRNAVGISDSRLVSSNSESVQFAHMNVRARSRPDSEVIEGIVLDSTESGVVRDGEVELTSGDEASLNSAFGIRTRNTEEVSLTGLSIYGDVEQALETYGLRDGRPSNGPGGPGSGSADLLIQNVDVSLGLAGVSAHCVQLSRTDGRNGVPFQGNSFRCDAPRNNQPFTLLTLLGTDDIQLEGNTFDAMPPMHGGELRVTFLVDGYQNPTSLFYSNLPRADRLSSPTFSAPASSDLNVYGNRLRASGLAPGLVYGFLVADGPERNDYENNVLILPNEGTALIGLNGRFRFMHNTVILNGDEPIETRAITVADSGGPSRPQILVNNLIVAPESPSLIAFEFPDALVPEELRNNVVVAPLVTGVVTMVSRNGTLYSATDWSAVAPSGHQANTVSVMTVEEDGTICSADAATVPAFSGAERVDIEGISRAGAVVNPGAYVAGIDACD